MRNQGVIADAVKYTQSLWHHNNHLFIAAGLGSRVEEFTSGHILLIYLVGASKQFMLWNAGNKSISKATYAVMTTCLHVFAVETAQRCPCLVLGVAYVS